ncbi:serine/threonine protein kinase [Anaeramoeba ignava]|uniref:Serine/threonine protein kinase n=1 Tax=Anaeramoeba ignava TaxID=1746090 RepID=A0A9Q0L9Z4_ANAIG|nr:serine/threonine protein kinase [Anaeramoeba ignava]
MEEPEICPICFKNYSNERKPMMICQESHNICVHCVKKFNSCPFCKSSFNHFKPIPNLILLKFIGSIPKNTNEPIIPFIPISELEVESKPFAFGGFAQIFKAKWKGKDVVIKRLMLMDNPKNNQQFENELKLGMKLSHPHIIKMYGKTEKDNMIGIVMEYAEQGDLSQKIPNLKYEEQIEYSLQIIKGIEVLHSNLIIHRDLKPENILISNNQAKITDFGISKVRDHSLQVTSAIISIGYSAPELSEKGKKYDNSCDIFSLSMILYEIFSKKKAFENENHLQLLGSLMKGERPEFPNNFPKELSELIKKGWSSNPKERCSLNEFTKCLNMMKNKKIPKPKKTNQTQIFHQIDNSNQISNNNFGNQFQENQNISKLSQNENPEICPICFKNYSNERKPMIICQESHNICVHCVKKFNSCPFCKSSFNHFKPIPNLILLKFIGSIPKNTNEPIIPFIPISELEVESKPFFIGGFAQIFKAKWKGKDVVIKRMMFLYDPKNNQQFENEIKLGMKLLHPHIIKMYGKTEMDNMIGIVMEYAEQGELKQKIPNLKYEEQIEYSLQIIKGIDYLHSNLIIHHDLKPQNILLSNNQTKIAGFGISKVRDHSLQVSSVIVSLGYSAPELFEKGKKYDNSCDIFSLSMILYEIFSKKKTFENENAMEITFKLMKGERPEFPNNFPKELSELIKKGWSSNPKERCSLNEFTKCLNMMKNKNNSNKISNNNFGNQFQENQNISKLSQNENPEICPICFKNYSNERKPMIICQESHNICVHCVKKFNSCPFCKSSFNHFKPFVNHPFLKFIGSIPKNTNEPIIPFIPISELEVESKPFFIGGFAQIFKAKWKGKDVVIKRMMFMDNPKNNQQFENEIKLGMKLSHPHIIKMYGKTEKDNMIGIVMEYAEQGDLSQKIPNLKYEEQIEYSLQIIKGIDYLHSNLIIHRDLQPENILLTNNQTKITDFRISKIRDHSLQVTSAIVSLGYSAPELFEKGKKYDNSCDIFSLSMILYEIFSKKKAFENENNLQLFGALMKGERPKFPNNFPKELSELIKKGWSSNPKERCSLNEFTECLNMMKDRNQSKTRQTNQSNQSNQINQKKGRSPIFSRPRNNTIHVSNQATTPRNQNNWNQQNRSPRQTTFQSIQTNERNPSPKAFSIHSPQEKQQNHKISSPTQRQFQFTNQNQTLTNQEKDNKILSVKQPFHSSSNRIPRNLKGQSMMFNPALISQQFSNLEKREPNFTEEFQISENKTQEIPKSKKNGNFKYQAQIDDDQEKEIDFENIPQEWKQLFRISGVKKSDLKDKKTMKSLLDIAAQEIKQIQNSGKKK